MAWDRKEYDRKRASEIYEDFKIRRIEVFKLFNNECFLCGKTAKVGFHLHHTEYHPVESNYPRHSKSMYVRLKRLNEAEKNPNRFVLLCPIHHKLIEIIKSSKIDLDRLKSLI